MRILLASPPLHGHMRPLIGLGRTLAARGHEVHALVAHGIDVRDDPAITLHRYDGSWSPQPGARDFDVPRDDLGASRAWVAFDAQERAAAAPYAAALDDLDPDVVVADTTFGRAALDRRRHALIWHSPTYVSTPMLSSLSRGEEDHPDPVLVAVAPFLNRDAARVPDGVHFIGPAPLPEMDAGAGGDVAYISAGTSFHRDPALFSDAIMSLDGLSLHPVISTGDEGVAARLRRRYPHVEVHAWVDQARLLARSAVFVSTGGMGSLQQAIALGVPSVVVPQSAEQRMNAQACADAGCGVLLERTDVTPDSLTRAIGFVHRSPRIRRSLTERARELRDLSRSSVAIEVIESARSST